MIVGACSAKEVVERMLVSDGDKNRAQRKLVFSPKQLHVGIAGAMLDDQAQAIILFSQDKISQLSKENGPIPVKQIPKPSKQTFCDVSNYNAKDIIQPKVLSGASTPKKNKLQCPRTSIKQDKFNAIPDYK